MFEKLIFRFFGQTFKVNNLATFFQENWGERWPSYWPWSFHMFLLKLCFFGQKIILLAKRRIFLKENKNNNTMNKGGQVID